MWAKYLPWKTFIFLTYTFSFFHFTLILLFYLLNQKVRLSFKEVKAKYFTDQKVSSVYQFLISGDVKVFYKKDKTRDGNSGV